MTPPRWFTAPEIVADVRQAVQFLLDHARDFDVDPDRLGVWGGSGGGYLALGMTPDPEAAAGSGDAARDGGRIAAVVAYYPI